MNAITTVPGQELAIAAAVMRAVGEAANEAAEAHVFADYLERKAENTRIAQLADLRLFATYLASIAGGVAMPSGEALQTTGAAWAGVTWGLVAAFVEWLKREGYAVGTINRALSTVKGYAKLAAKAGAVTTHELALIRVVAGYGGKEARRMDAARVDAGAPTRRGQKKAAHTRITAAQAKELKTHPDTPQGRRDALLMALFLDHGLRESEAALLDVGGVDLAAGTITFYRPKVDGTDTQHMTPATRRAMGAWFASGDAPALGPILRSTRKGGALTAGAMSLSAMRQRVRALGLAVGLSGLSPHDCRHYWATAMGRMVAAGRMDLFRLQEMGGWSSLAMPRRYVERAAVSNAGVAYEDD